MSSKQTGPGGCNADKSTQGNAKEDTLILYLSNESSERRMVDIKLFVDGELKVETNLEKKLHQRSEYTFALEPGKHVVRVKTDKGEAQLDKEFTISKKHWMAISYFYSPGNKGGIVEGPVFTYRFENEPILFR